MFKKLVSTLALMLALSPMSALAQAASTIISGQTTCTGSAQLVTSSSWTNGLIIKAGYNNTGIIYVGPSGVTTANGYPLKAGEAISYGTYPGAFSSKIQAYVICANSSGDAFYNTGN